MDEEQVRRELGEMLGPRFGASDVSEDQRRELVEAFRSCGVAFLEVLSGLEQPLRAAYLLRLAARACHRFAGLAERIGAGERASDARETARDVESLANEAEALRAGPARPPFVAWW